MQRHKETIRGGYICKNKQNYVSLMNTSDDNENTSDPLILIEKEANTPSPDHYQLTRSYDWSHRKSIPGFGAVWNRSKRKCLPSIPNNSNHTTHKHTTNESIHSSSKNQQNIKHIQQKPVTNINIVNTKQEEKDDMTWYLICNALICIGIFLLFD